MLILAMILKWSMMTTDTTKILDRSRFVNIRLRRTKQILLEISCLF